MKKYILMPFGYEYNDNTYDREGLDLKGAKHYDTTKEANKERIDRLPSRIAELEENYYSALDCIPYEVRVKVNGILGDSGESGTDDLSQLLEPGNNKLDEESKEKILNIMAPYVYEIVEVDMDKDSAEIEFSDDGDYYKNIYNIKVKENDNSVVLHSLEGPAHKTIWSDYDDENEYHFYIDGVKMSEDEWTQKKRESKITQVVGSEKGNL